MRYPYIVSFKQGSGSFIAGQKLIFKYLQEY